MKMTAAFLIVNLLAMHVARAQTATAPTPAATAATNAAPSSAAPAAEPDFSEVETLLQQMDRDRQDLVNNQTKSLYSQLSALLSQNAVLLDAYKSAYEFVNFEGDAKEHAKAKDWEQKNKALFQDDSFQWALKAHVQYLLATLMKRLGDDEAAMKMTKEWITAFPSAPEKFKEVARHEILTGGITGSIFLRANTQAYDLATRRVMMGSGRGTSGAAGQQVSLLQGLTCWYLGNLTNLPEVHRVNVIAFLRAKRDPRIFEEWKNNLVLEQQIAERDSLAAQRENHTMHRRPWLLWQTGKDYALFGQPRQAVDTLMAALKESPRCNDYDAIVAEIRRVIAEARKAKGR